MGRRLVLTALTAALTLAAVELSSFLFFTLARDRFEFAKPSQYVLPAERVRGLLAHGWYDAELGWNSHYPTAHGERPRAKAPRGRVLLAAFGDSFVHGDEVEDAETWEEALGARLGADILNFGVPGYGVDQALLFYRRKARELAAPIVTLGFPLGDLNRIVNCYRPFYLRRTGLPLTKPRFTLDGGALRLIANPVTSAAQLASLSDPAFIERIGREDFWYARKPQLGFPYAALLFSRSLWGDALSKRSSSGEGEDRRQEAIWEDTAARALFFAILGAFVDEVSATGGRPVIALMPDRSATKDLRQGRRDFAGYAETLRQCQRQGWECFDGPAALAERTRGRPLQRYYMPGGHPSALANAEIAGAFAAWLQERQLLPDR
jgi:hypothetical protein